MARGVTRLLVLVLLCGLCLGQQTSSSTSTSSSSPSILPSSTSSSSSSATSSIQIINPTSSSSSSAAPSIQIINPSSSSSASSSGTNSPSSINSTPFTSSATSSSSASRSGSSTNPSTTRSAIILPSASPSRSSTSSPSSSSQPSNLVSTNPSTSVSGTFVPSLTTLSSSPSRPVQPTLSSSPSKPVQPTPSISPSPSQLQPTPSITPSLSAPNNPFPSPSGSSIPSSTSPSSSALPTNRYNAAEQMMLVLIAYVIKEGGGSVTQGCVLRKQGSGIFSPPALARGFHALSQAMYNAWTRYHPWANATVAADDIPRVLSGTPSSGFSFSAPDAQEAVVRSAYLIIQYLLPERTAMSNLAGQIANYYGIDVSSTANMQNMASQIAWTLTNRLITKLNNDNSNQQGCYVDTGNTVAINPPTWLDTYENVTLAAERIRSPISWSQIAKPPLINAPAPFLNPNAAVYKPFAINVNNILPPPLPNMTIINAMMMELPNVQATLDSLDSYNKMIVEYWIDGGGSPSPPGHWVYIAIKDVSQVKNYTLSQSVRLLFLVTASVYDAGIAVWNAKRFYSTVRPGTYIPCLMYKNMDIILNNQYVGPYCKHQDIPVWTWIPYQPLGLNSPPFPEYPSGHSTFSGAASNALGNFTGSQNWPGGPKTVTIDPGMSLFSYQCFKNGTNMYGNPCVYASCRIDPSRNSENAYIPSRPVTLGPFPTYNDAASQAGLSRIMGGIHIWVSNVEGLALGARVTEAVFLKACQMMPCGESDQFDYSPTSPSPAGGVTLAPTVAAASQCVQVGSSDGSATTALSNSAVLALLKLLRLL